MAAATEQGEEQKAIFQKYMYQLIYRVMTSIGERATKDNPVRSMVVIWDMEGFTVRQLASLNGRPRQDRNIQAIQDKASCRY